MKLMPKFLTQEMARKAIEHVWAVIVCGGTYHAFIPKRRACHIVVIAPEMEVPNDGEPETYPNYPLKPVILHEQSFGVVDPDSNDYDQADPEMRWTANYADIARCKAFKLWNNQNDGRTDILPHLMYSGDSPFWGGVKREGIVVACSGVEPWFDRMISGIVADMLIAGSYHAWMSSKDKKEDLDNLT